MSFGLTFSFAVALLQPLLGVMTDAFYRIVMYVSCYVTKCQRLPIRRYFLERVSATLQRLRRVAAEGDQSLGSDDLSPEAVRDLLRKYESALRELANAFCKHRTDAAPLMAACILGYPEVMHPETFVSANLWPLIEEVDRWTQQLRMSRRGAAGVSLLSSGRGPAASASMSPVIASASSAATSAPASSKAASTSASSAVASSVATSAPASVSSVPASSSASSEAASASASSAVAPVLSSSCSASAVPVASPLDAAIDGDCDVEGALRAALDVAEGDSADLGDPRVRGAFMPQHYLKTPVADGVPVSISLSGQRKRGAAVAVDSHDYQYRPAQFEQ